MTQPQHDSPSAHVPHPDNPAERLAQADRVIERERKKHQQTVERRQAPITGSYRRRRKGDR